MKQRWCVVLVVAWLSACAASQAKPSPAEANKKLVLDFFRVVFEAEDADAAKQFLTEDYIQHNPRVPTGRDGFITTFKGMFHGPKPVAAQLAHPPVAVLADGDLVTVVWKRPRPDPADPAKSYDSFGFDMFRIQDGKLAEHWDGASK